MSVLETPEMLNDKNADDDKAKKLQVRSQKVGHVPSIRRRFEKIMYKDRMCFSKT